jgi:hypothetical protein
LGSGKYKGMSSNLNAKDHSAAVKKMIDFWGEGIGNYYIMIDKATA